MSSTIQRVTCPLTTTCEKALASLVAKRRSFTARSIDRLIRVARTLADLEGRDDITEDHLIIAATFRDVDPVADHQPKVA